MPDGSCNRERVQRTENKVNALLKTIRDNVVLPLVTRLGTMLGTVLIGAGVQQELAEQAILGAIAMCLIAFDLVMSYISRQNTKKEALKNGNV